MNVMERTWTVADVMVEDVVTVRPETPYKELVEALWVRGISGLPVVDSGGRLMGIVSEMDLLAKQEHPATDAALQMRYLLLMPSEQQSPATYSALADLWKAGGRTAADVMTSPAVTITPDASLTEAATLMHTRGLKRLPVVDRAGHVIGIISRADLLKVFLRSDETIESDAREVLREVMSAPDGVTVTVTRGLVTLEGEVAAPEEAEAVVRRTEDLPGVVGVDDRLSRRRLDGGRG